jgi:hypothetical protein
MKQLHSLPLLVLMALALVAVGCSKPRDKHELTELKLGLCKAAADNYADTASETWPGKWRCNAMDRCLRWGGHLLTPEQREALIAMIQNGHCMPPWEKID